MKGQQVQVLTVDIEHQVPVALRAQTQGFPGRVDPVDDGGGPVFIVVGAALVVGHGIAVKTGGGVLFVGGGWQQVAGQLFDDKLVVWQIVVEGSYQLVEGGEKQKRQKKVKNRKTDGVHPDSPIAFPQEKDRKAESSNSLTKIEESRKKELK